MSSRAQLVQAPDRPVLQSKATVFLAGNTTQASDGHDWRQSVTGALGALPITVLNPKRNDWDSTWREDFSDARWTEQVQWELDMQEIADIVVLLFHPVSLAPITMMELGLCAGSGKAIVCVLDGFSKAGNVEAVCQRHGIILVRTEEDLVKAITTQLQTRFEI